MDLMYVQSISIVPFNFARGGPGMHYITSPSVGVSMEMPPFTMTLFQSAHGQ